MTNNQINMQMSLSDFIVEKVIGEGSYGRAVLCKQISNGKYVVIKEISLQKLTEQEQRDAWKETKVLSLLHHPNIITYYGCFLQNNVLHIVMEYADNGDLSEEIQKSLKNNQHFDEDTILNWFVQICLAIKHLHDRKILHRDLKNQNIFLLKDNTAKLGDFGIAKMLSSTSQMSNTAIGTPYYLSPEICQGKSYNMKSDIWSLGCILYELCTLHHPFDSNCLNGLIIKIQRAKPPPIPYYYSSNLRNLVEKLLQKVPSKRPTINQVLDLDFIRCRVPSFLSQTIEKKEFCHTILHDFKPGESPEKAKVTPEDVENNNANLHYEIKKDEGKNKVSIKNKNRQIPYRNALKCQNKITSDSDNRRKVNRGEYNFQSPSPRVQQRKQIVPSPRVRYKNQEPQCKKLDFKDLQESEEENEKMETDEQAKLSSNENDQNYDSESSYSNQNVDFDKQRKQRKIIRRRNNKNRLNYIQNDNVRISAAENLQAKKNSVLADREMVRKEREKRAIEEQIAQIKNDEKRREIQAKAKAREIQRKEQMRRLKQEEKERQEKYKKLKPTFKIDRNVHFNKGDGSSNADSESNYESDYVNEQRIERMKKRKEDEAKKEKLRKNAIQIADKIKSNQFSSSSSSNLFCSSEQESENNMEPVNKKRDDISSLRSFLQQRRSELKKNKSKEDIIMIGNIKYVVGQNENEIQNENLAQNNKYNKESQDVRRKSKKEIEDEVYGLIFDNYSTESNELPNSSPDSNKNENKSSFEDLLLTSDSEKNNSGAPEANKSPENLNQNNFLLSSNSNGNSFNSLNNELPSDNNSENKSSPTNNYASSSTPYLESSSPLSPTNKEIPAENQPFSSPPLNSDSNLDFNQNSYLDDACSQNEENPNFDADNFNDYSPNNQFISTNNKSSPDANIEYNPDNGNNEFSPDTNDYNINNNSIEYSPNQDKYSAANNECNNDFNDYSNINNEYSPDANKFTPTSNEYSPDVNKITPTSNEYSPEFNEFAANNNEYSPEFNEFAANNNEYSPTANKYDTANNECSPKINDEYNINFNENKAQDELTPIDSQLNSNYNDGKIIIDENKDEVYFDDAPNANENIKNNKDYLGDDINLPSKDKSDTINSEIVQQEQPKENECNEAANHQNTIITKLDKLLMDSFSDSAISDDEESKNTEIMIIQKGQQDEEENDPKTEISIDTTDDTITIDNPADHNDNIDQEKESPNAHYNAFSSNYLFTFKGSQLQLKNIKSNDSLAYKIESVRKFIEDSIGTDNCIKAYHLIKENGILDNFEGILPSSDEQSYYQLLLQLLSSEDILLAKWLK